MAHLQSQAQPQPQPQTESQSESQSLPQSQQQSRSQSQSELHSQTESQFAGSTMEAPADLLQSTAGVPQQELSAGFFRMGAAQEVGQEYAGAVPQESEESEESEGVDISEGSEEAEGREGWQEEAQEGSVSSAGDTTTQEQEQASMGMYDNTGESLDDPEANEGGKGPRQEGGAVGEEELKGRGRSLKKQRNVRKLKKKAKPGGDESVGPGGRDRLVEALAKLGDGRIFIPGTPLGPPPSPLLPPPPSPPPSPPAPTARVSAKRRQGVLAADGAVIVRVQAKRDDLNYYISPQIYGVNEYGYDKNFTAIRNAMLDAGIKLVRRGGNGDSRYNWLYDVRNKASDWYFENHRLDGEGNYTSVDMLYRTTKQGGGDVLLTIPVMGWLPKARDSTCSFSVKKYGPQKRFDPWYQDCGNGQSNITGNNIQNDPTDAAALYGPDHQKQFVKSLVDRWGNAANGGVRFYCLDNEPLWWSYMHWDVHPNHSTYNEILERHLAYAAVVKKADPTVAILGPVTSGWAEIFFTMTDLQGGWSTRPWKFWSNPVDRKRHGDVPFLQWYLENMAAYEAAYGTRLLDIVDLHMYTAGKAGNDATDPASQAARVAATRALWDPTYRCNDTTCDWCDPVNCPDGIPRVLVRAQEMINSAYPGLGLALTEYNYGGRNDASGAVAQAECLGIFGKLRMKMATVFSGPKAQTTVYQAFKMFGNYDNKGGAFGNLGVDAVSSNYTAVSAYAAINYAKNALTVLLINLTPDNQQVTLNLLDVSPAGPIKYYRYDSSNLSAIVPMPSFDPASSLTYTFSGYSLNMLEVPYS